MRLPIVIYDGLRVADNSGVMSYDGTCCPESDGGVGALSASFAARLANFFCSRRSALARCFSCRFISFWRFWNVMLKGLLRTPVLFYFNGTASPGTFAKRTNKAGTRRVAQFAQRLRFDLANTFARDGEYLADFFEGARTAVLKTKTHAEDAFLAGAEFPQH